MLRILYSIAVIFLLGSCTGFKPLAMTGNNQASLSSSSEKKKPRFLDDGSTTTTIEEKNEVAVLNKPVTTVNPDNKSANTNTSGVRTSTKRNISNIENANSLQIKYAVLLNTEVERVQNIPLYQEIDEWYGVKYKLGGTTKNGIDCSAFVQTIVGSALGITLPRTAKDQYNFTRRISSTELKEGDLLFFNTRGGVSHVGIYLMNNKFVHASVSGVTISDMFDPYYARHFIAAGRIVKTSSAMNDKNKSKNPALK